MSEPLPSPPPPSGPMGSSPVVPYLLWHCTARYWRAQPGRSFLLLCLLATGIAVFLSIRLANRAAVSSFTRFTEVLTRQSDAVLAPAAGTLPESILPQIRGALEEDGTSRPVIQEILPVVESIAGMPRPESEASGGTRTTYTLIGVDLIALQNLSTTREQDRSWFNQKKKAHGQNTNTASRTTPSGVPSAGTAGAAGPQEGAPESDGWEKLLNRSDAVFCSSALARDQGLQVGSKLPVVLHEKRVELEVAGIIPGRSDQPAAPENLLVMDLPALQSLTNKRGQLDRVEFLFTDAIRKSERSKEAALLRLGEACAGAGVLRTPEARQAAAEVMTRGFRLNLTILSLIALLVGLYLIFQTLDAAVLKRRNEIGILRALGVHESEVRRIWLWEALLLGSAGGVLGILGGWALAQATVRGVSQTVNALYYASNAKAAALDPWEAAGALLLAVAASLVAGWIPARRAALTPPAQLWSRGTDLPAADATPERGPFHESAESSWTRLASPLRPALPGLLLVALALGLGFLPAWRLADGTPFALAGYASALLGVIGTGVVAAHTLPFLAALTTLVRAAPNSPSLHVARSHLRRPGSRHRWAVAGLVCSVAMCGGMAVLVASFRGSVSAWISQTLQADVYLTSDANQNAGALNRISPEALHRIVSHPAVSEWDAALIAPVEMPGGRARVTGASLAFAKRHNLLQWLLPPGDASAFDASQNRDTALVSESFAARFRVSRGDTVRLPTPSGVRPLQIAGVYTDYSDEKGVVLVERVHMQDWFRTDSVSTVSLILHKDSDAETHRAALRSEFPGLAVFTNALLRAEVLRIFAQTFAITYALEGIGVVVALTGLGITLLSVLAERRSELTTLRALGMHHAQIARMAAWEGWFLSLAGTLGGLLASLGLGVLLVHVINKQTFGWTLRLDPWPAPLLLLAVIIPVSGTLVAWLAGTHGADLPADRNE